MEFTPKRNWKPTPEEPEWKKRRREVRNAAFEWGTAFGGNSAFFSILIAGGLLTGHWIAAFLVAVVSAILMGLVVGALFALAAHIAETEK